MRNKLISFFIFQIIAWILFFNWEGYRYQYNETSEKIIQVVENPVSRITANQSNLNMYQLVLRNDGFFTRINHDLTKENGIWSINYDIPSIIFKSSMGEYNYRILENSSESIQLELINAHEIVKDRKTNKDNTTTLFSASSKK